MPARFTVITPECIRIEHSPTGAFVDAPSMFAAARPAGACSYTARPGDPELGIDTGAIRLTYRPDGRPPSNANLLAHLVSRPGSEVRFPGTDAGETRGKANLGGTLETLDLVRGRVPLLDGILSRDGWYVLDDSSSHLLVDGWAVERPAEVAGNTDWYLFGYGDDYPAALRALMAVAGRVPMPRRAALGSWYSRYWPYSSKEYRGIVEEYDRRGFPLDVMVLDMDWHRPGWTGWSWNRELLPDAEELMEWFHAQGLQVTLNLHPADGVGPHEDGYAAFMRALGRAAGPREALPFDAGDRRYMEALFRHVLDPLEDRRPGPREGEAGPTGKRGVDFWWVDWQQFRFTRSLPKLENLRWLNQLFFRHTSQGGARGISFSRWAGWGDHRHPVHFSGDAHTGWESLAFQVPFTSTAGNAGCFFWSHDIGGHFGARLEEATARWVQFGALSAALRLHSARSGDLDRRPWTYAPEYEESMRRAFRLRAALFPYIYTAVRRCHDEALPLLRPMYLSHPREETAYRCPQQYMLGDHVLVAPITSPGLGKRKVATQAVWFPPSFFSTPLRLCVSASSWFNLDTAERYGANTEQIVGADIDEVPVFVPGGVPIPMRPADPPTLRMAAAPLDHLVVRVFPGDPGAVREGVLYEDDGATDTYKEGRCAWTPLRAAWSFNEGTGDDALVLTIGPTAGEFEGQVLERAHTVELPGVAAVARLEVDGRAVGASLETGTARVRIPARSVREAITVSITYTPVDFEENNAGHRARRMAGAAGGGQQWNIPSLDRGELAAMGVGAGVAIRYDPDHNELRVYDSGGYYQNQPVTLEVTQGTKRAEVLARHTITIDRARPTVVAAPARPLPAAVPGLVTCRKATLSHVWHDSRLSASAVLAEVCAPLTGWSVAGPFPFVPTRPLVEQSHPPEQVRKARIDWRPSPPPGKAPADYWPTDFRAIYGSRNGEALAYARLAVVSPVRQEAAVIVESGDRAQVWVNGVLVFSSETLKGNDLAGGRAAVTLEEGENVLLVKTNEGGGGWGFRLAIDGVAPVAAVGGAGA